MSQPVSVSQFNGLSSDVVWADFDGRELQVLDQTGQALGGL
jgi:hypothetical protein